MRRPVMLGIALMVAGGTVFLRGLSAEREVVRAGDVTVSVGQPNPVLAWVAVLAVIAGIVLVSAGRRHGA